MNLIQTWQQGEFIDMSKYKHMPDEWKQKQEFIEQCLVRPGPTDNAICNAVSPSIAKWIARRLNLASVLEQMTYDYATGKTDGSEIVKLVHDNINA